MIRASVLIGAAFVVALAAVGSPAEPPRFFFAGNGRLQLHHGHFNTTLDVRYRHADGSYNDTALAEIRRFFRSREDGREGDVSLRLVELLSFVQSRFHPRQMTLMSGYRSPTFNADIRAAGGKAAQASLHTEGLAADVAFAGLDLRRLWLQLRELQVGGAGYYRTGKFLHLDTGKPRFWEETTSRVDENLAAGNARAFVRTDFDRYTDLDGALVNLHSVTRFPLAVRTEARLAGPDGTRTVRLAAARGTQLDGECIVLPEYADAYQFRVAATGEPAPGPGTWRVVLSTCEPRTERTPPEVESNPLEVTRR
jgi:uncharacterized protein YcbK (DUF882 family)